MTALQSMTIKEKNRSLDLLGKLKQWPFVPFTLLLPVIICGLFGPWFFPHDPTAMKLSATLQPAGWMSGGDWAYLLGTDNMGLIFVTHDLGIVAETCDHVAIIYAGRIVEYGCVNRIFENPAYPYTRALLRALPKIGTHKQRLNQIQGEPPNLTRLPPGCSFHPRCTSAMDICRRQYPPTITIGPNERAACWLLHPGEE